MDIRLKADKIQSVLMPGSSWVPFTDAFWKVLPDDLRSALIGYAQSFADFDWPTILAEDYMAYRREGGRTVMQEPYFARRDALVSLVLGECAEGKGRFLDDIINGIWSICEETSWTISAHNQSARYPEALLPDPQEPTVDLFSAETAAILAWAVHLLREQLDNETRVICDRTVSEIDCRVITPYHRRWDFWYMGRSGAQINNWTPWIASNLLGATLLLVDDPARRASIVEKSLQLVQMFLDTYEEDGGCDEGASYWRYAAGAMFVAFEYLYLASGGKLNFFDDKKVRNMGRYIARAHISKDWFVNFADGAAKLTLPVGVIYRYGFRIGSDEMMSLAAETAKIFGGHRLTRSETFRELLTLADWQDVLAFEPKKPEPEVFIQGIDVMIARERADGGFFVAAKAGNNSESHNHNDVGQFIIFHDGQPVLIDVGVETYTRKTFSADRYSIWTMGSDWHNLPTIGGVTQSPGTEYYARDVIYDPSPALSMDIAGAYPPQAGVKNWKRKVALDRQNQEVTIDDSWLLEAAQPVELHLITAFEPNVQGDVLVLPVGESGVEVSIPEGCEVNIERKLIEDQLLSAVWGEEIWRVGLTFPPANAGKYSIHVRKLSAKSAV